MKALVTGATGFIGGALAAGLVEQGAEVRVLVRPGSRNKLARPDRHIIIEGDLDADAGLLGEAAAGCDVVYHAAAIRNRWGTPPDEYRRANVEGTRRLLDAAAAGRAKRFVYVSSVGVVGWPGVEGIDESFPIPTRSGKADYHGTKAEAENVVREYGDIEAVVSRPTITYGPGDADGMVTRLAAMIAGGRFVRVGRGTNHVHLTYIDDMVRGLILTGTHPAAAGQTFILAGPASIAVRDLVGRIETALGLSSRTFYVPETVARPIAWGVERLYRLASAVAKTGCPPLTRDKIDTLCVHRGFSSAKATRLLGYAPRVDYDEGLARTLAWMAEEGRLKWSPVSANGPRPAPDSAPAH